MHCSRSLWLPSNGSPMEVDLLICQNVSPAEMAPIPSYPRRRKPATCTALSTRCRIRSRPRVFSRHQRDFGGHRRAAELVLPPQGARDPRESSALAPQNLAPAATWPAGPPASKRCFRLWLVGCCCRCQSGSSCPRTWNSPPTPTPTPSCCHLGSVCRLQATGEAPPPCVCSQ